MDSIFDLGRRLYDLVSNFLRDSGYLRIFAGVVGIAFSLYWTRRHQLTTGGGPGQTASHTGSHGPKHASTVLSASAQHVKRRLGAHRRVLLAVPDVVLRLEGEGGGGQGYSTEAVEGALGIVRDLAAVSDLYLVAHCPEAAEAALRSRLEEAGVLGASRPLLPPHRLLFCGTALEGKVAIARQLDPDWFIDSDVKVVNELGRFFKAPKRVVLVNGSGRVADHAHVQVVGGIAELFA